MSKTPKAAAKAAAKSATKPPAKPASKSASKNGNIYIGIGGWTFEPWRGVFYPEKLTQAKELAYAASKLTSIEINGTYYGSQKPESFRKWAREVPDGFVFSLKGPRFATNRRVLAEAGDSVKRFYDSGVLELGDRLGPVLWQFAPTKKFDEADFGKFLELLPRKLDGRALRHVVEVRHDSFCAPDFIALLRQFETPVVFAEHGKYPAIADVAGDFVYARLQKGNDEIKTCYPPKQLDAWAKRLQLWADGGEPDDLPRVDEDQAEEGAARRVRLCDPRGQDPRAGRRDGIDRAREITGRRPMARAKKLFTIGYEQTPAKSVLDELERAGVKLLVDVRAVASSRRPGFSKNQLAAGPRRARHFLSASARAGHAEGRPRGRAQRQIRRAAQDLRRASEDAAGERGTRRTVGAGEEVRPGLHPLLRARPHPLPPAMDRRDHRGPRRREDREFGRAADIKRHCERSEAIQSFHLALDCFGRFAPRNDGPSSYPSRHTAIGCS